ncbi:General secretion pathway protein K [hydrothermal vent metagenome]|uniref:General secretion pathway protein K n=1 Tax=hydrothermal vent metagenome TaxID=652676 RepID=A0A3B1B5Q4_9ZZZZ
MIGPGIQSNQGVALITVLLVVTMATTAAVAMSSRQHLDIRRTENTLFIGQASEYLYGVELWSKQILAKDLKDNKTDDTTEAWATRLPPLPVEGGYVTGYLEDLQGRINLNNLQQTGATGTREQARLKRLLAQLEINEGVVNLLLDWIDADQEARFPEGAEDGYYLGLQPPYRSANRLLQSSSELMLLKDMTQAQVNKLEPFISTLPQNTDININTASIEVLMSLADDLSADELQLLIKKREDKAYEKVEDFLAEKAFATKTITTDGLSVSSNYFILHAEAGIGTLKQFRTCLFERNQKGGIKTLMRSEGVI